MTSINLPLISNAAITQSSHSIEGRLELKKFTNFKFVQNVAFDETLVYFNESYQNDQSRSGLFKKHLSDVYSLIKSHGYKGQKLVEVGCGKGAFLNIVKADGHFNYTGYDTAYQGNDANIKSRYVEYSDLTKADIVVMRHSLDYIKSPHIFLEKMMNIFGKDALIFIEVPQLEWIEKHRNLFDFTYERPNYFSTESLCSLFYDIKRQGFFFGDQYQYCLARLGSLQIDKWQGFDSNKNWESYNLDAYFQKFLENVEFLFQYKRIWLWGAGNKGVLFLKYLADITPAIFQRVISVVDMNESKQGRYTPSTKLPIISPKQMFSEFLDTDYVLVINPIYLEEIQKILEENITFPVNIGCI